MLCRALGVVTLLALVQPAPAGEDPKHELYFVESGVGKKIDFANRCGAAEKNYLTETLGAGAAWLDYDGDGHLDLFLPNGSDHARPDGAGQPDRLFRGDGKGGFTDVTAKAAVGGRGWGQGVAVGDVDNDGDTDLYVTNLGRNTFYLNNGDGTFSDATERSGLGNSSWSVCGAFFDMEGDGDLDLYLGNYVEFDLPSTPRRGVRRTTSPLCNYKGLPTACGPVGLPAARDVLFRNNGDGTFSDATGRAGLQLSQPLYTLGVVTGDYDNDGDQDIYIANDSVQNLLWRNRGDGTFEDVALLTLAALNLDGQPQSSMGVALGDYNGDGFLDLISTNFSHDVNTLYRNEGGKYFIDESTRVGMGATTMALSWGAGFYDFDNDADLDLFIANGHIYHDVDKLGSGTTYLQANHLFVNQADKFVEVGASAGSGLAPKRSFRGAAFADYDEDGDVDILATAIDDRILLMRNESRGKGNYLRLQLEGTVSNRDAVGARVTVSAGGRRQIRERHGGGSFMSVSEPALHFGLGPATTVETVTIRWPSGKTKTLNNVKANRTLKVKEE